MNIERVKKHVQIGHSTFENAFQIRFEFISDSGMHWNMLFEEVSPDEPIVVGHTLIMLVVDGVLLVIITWYIEAVNPGGGVAQKPYFFLLVSFAKFLCLEFNLIFIYEIYCLHISNTSIKKSWFIK